MNSDCEYIVHTHRGWFHLDEGAYQDYLAGKLWITWMPDKPRSGQTAEDPVPVNITKEALRLRDAAQKSDARSVFCRRFPGEPEEVPYKSRMSDIPIDEMCLSVRSTNALMRAGANTFGKLKIKFEDDNGLRNIRNLGIKSETEIRLCFFNHCYRLLSENEKAAWWQSMIDGFPPAAGGFPGKPKVADAGNTAMKAAYLFLLLFPRIYVIIPAECSYSISGRFTTCLIPVPILFLMIRSKTNDS